MTEYFPKSEQIDTLNGKLDALNETLKKREDFVSAVAKMEAATASAESATTAANAAATNANTAAAGVVSPTASVTKSGTTTTVTVTDKSGTTTAEVRDGSDAAVTKDNIVSALGYEPVAPYDGYELINTIELAESPVEVKVTQDGNGNEFKLRSCYVECVAPSGMTNNAGLTSGPLITKNGKAVLGNTYCTILLAVNRQTGKVWADCAGSMIRIYYEGFDKWGSREPSITTSTTIDPGTGIHGWDLYSGGGIPAGTAFKIYGIRM